MNRVVLDNFMERYGIATGDLKIYYSFDNGSGEVLWNNVYTTGEHYLESCLLAARYPGLSVGLSEGPSSGVVGFGTFSYTDLLRIGYQLSDTNWTTFLDFEPLNHCGNEQAELSVLMTNKTAVTDDGFILGLNKSNRLVFENWYGAQKTNQILFDEIADGAVISLTKDTNTFELTYHNHPQSEHNSISFELDNYNAQNNWYLGGIYTPIYGYNGLSGYFNEFLYFNSVIDKPTKDLFSKAFFVTGIVDATTSGQTQYIGAISSVTYDPSGFLGTGITNYTTSAIAIPQKVGADIDLCSLDAVTGYLIGETIQYVTGAPIPITNTIVVPARDLYDYDKLLTYSKSNLVYDQGITSDDVLELYTFREPRTDINLTLPYDVLYGLFSPSNTNSNIYFNGLYQQSGSDYSITGNYIYASGFTSVDGTLYDLITGVKQSYAYHNTGGGTYHIGGFDVSLNDIYLNGQKLVSGLAYSGAGTDLFLYDTANLATGSIQFVPRHTEIYQIKTGNTDLSSFKYVVEQAWLNGQRIKNNESYIRTNSCTIRGGNDTNEYGNVIYGNDDNFWNL